MTTMYSPHRLILSSMFGIYLTLSTLPTANAAIYTWIDNEGTVHYSDERPKDQTLKAKKINVRTKPYNPVDVDRNPQTTVKTAVKEEATDEENAVTTMQVPDNTAELKQKQKNINKAKQQRCWQARTELAILNKDIPVYLDNTEQYRLNWAGDTYTGKRNYLTDEERKEAQNKAKASLTEYCRNPNDEHAQAQARKKWAYSEYCLLNQAILKDLQRADIKASERQMNKQQALTDKYCDNQMITLSTDETEPEIFSRRSR